MYNLQAVSDYSEEAQTLRRFNPDRACLAVKTRDDVLLLQYLHDKNIPIVQCAVLTNAFVQELYFPHGGITARSKYYLTHNGFGSFFFFLFLCCCVRWSIIIISLVSSVLSLLLLHPTTPFLLIIIASSLSTHYHSWWWWAATCIIITSLSCIKELLLRPHIATVLIE